MTELMIDFTTQEAYTAKDFTPVPRGKYNVTVSDVELKEVAQGDNAGKPFIRTELTVLDGPYENRKIFTNIMLFPDKNSKLLAAMGILTALDKIGQYTPAGFMDAIEGGELVVQVRIAPAKGDYDARNEVQSWWKKGTSLGDANVALKPASAAAKGKRSLLPS